MFLRTGFFYSCPLLSLATLVHLQLFQILLEVRGHECILSHLEKQCSPVSKCNGTQSTPQTTFWATVQRYDPCFTWIFIMENNYNTYSVTKVIKMTFFSSSSCAFWWPPGPHYACFSSCHNFVQNKDEKKNDKHAAEQDKNKKRHALVHWRQPQLHVRGRLPW